MSTLPTSEEQSVMRKRTFKVRGIDDVRDVMEIVNREKFTGSVAIHVSQGAMSAATLEERARLSLDKQKD